MERRGGDLSTAGAASGSFGTAGYGRRRRNGPSIRRPERAAAPPAVFVQRQAICDPASPMTPSVRKSVHAPHASRMAATIDARRIPSGSRRVATAQATNAGPTNAGTRITKNTCP